MHPPLKDLVETLREVARQRVSVEDKEMRRGRKSKLFNGHKRHIARDIDQHLSIGDRSEGPEPVAYSWATT